MTQKGSLQQHTAQYSNYLLLLIVCLLAYWPLSLGIFSVKNDAIHYFLPYRYSISEAIRSGHLPLWSPYLYTGYPVQGDMQSGAWNPVVWIFSLISRYDLTLFHYENLLYIFLSGIGMYKLCNRIVSHSTTALVTGITYMLCGFMLSGQLINWLAAAAFFPFVIYYYLQLTDSFSWKPSIKTGIALYLLLTAGYPSFFIITGYILLILFILTCISQWKNKKTSTGSWKKLIATHLLLAAVFTGLSLPAIVSYVDLLPYYQRGGGTSFAETIINSFDWKHFLSFLFPSSIGASDVSSATDVTMRNVYIGLLPILLLLAIPPAKNRRNILLAVLSVAAILFSMGDLTPFRKICYQLVPLMNTFRHPAQVRMFLLVGLLLLAAPSLKKLLAGELSAAELKRLKTIVAIAGVLILVITLVAAFSSQVLRNMSGLSAASSRTILKSLIDAVSLPDALFLNGLIQFLFLLLVLILLVRKSNPARSIAFIHVCNMLLLAQLILPLTFVSKNSPRPLNTFIHDAATGFPVSGLDRSLQENSVTGLNDSIVTRQPYFYNKLVGISKITNSPSFLTEEENFLQTDLLYKYVASKPVYYLADTVLSLKDTVLLQSPLPGNPVFLEGSLPGVDTLSAKHEARLTDLSPNQFTLETKSEGQTILALTQSFHSDWKVSIDGQAATLLKTNMSFMGTIVPPGSHVVEFTFKPNRTLIALVIELITLLLLVLAGGLSLWQKRRINKTAA